MNRLSATALLGITALTAWGGGAVGATVVATMSEPFVYGNSADGFVPGTDYGTVTVQQLSDGSLYFQIQLEPGTTFFNQNNNSQHDAFAFDLAGVPSASFNITTQFTPPMGSPQPEFAVVNASSSPGVYTAGSFSEPPFNSPGTYDYAIDYLGKSLGLTQGSGTQTLDFYVSDAANNLTLKDIVPGANFGGVGIAFTSDIYSNGSTFNVGAVPEPSTWALMLMGVFGLGAVLRSSRRRNVSAVAAI
jgi:hypothetical protein